MVAWLRQVRAGYWLDLRGRARDGVRHRGSDHPGRMSGAVLLTPFQRSLLGMQVMAVAPTNLVYNIIATPRGRCTGLLPLGAWLTQVRAPKPGPCDAAVRSEEGERITAEIIPRISRTGSGLGARSGTRLTAWSGGPETAARGASGPMPKWPGSPTVPPRA